MSDFAQFGAPLGSILAPSGAGPASLGQGPASLGQGLESLGQGRAQKPFLLSFGGPWEPFSSLFGPRAPLKGDFRRLVARKWTYECLKRGENVTLAGSWASFSQACGTCVKHAQA